MSIIEQSFTEIFPEKQFYIIVIIYNKKWTSNYQHVNSKMVVQ